MRPVDPPGRGGPLPLAAVNGESLLELIADHHAIGIMDALVLAPIGALIVVGDRRHLLAWLLLVDGLVLGALNVAQQYAPLALGLTPRRLSLPGGELASWLASWAFVPGIVISVVFLVLLFPFRLWDIDRLVNRTLVHGVLLGVVYAGLVLVLGRLFGELGGRTPNWTVAAATLAVATPVPAGPPPRPAGGRPALQPAQARRGPDDRAVQRPPP